MWAWLRRPNNQKLLTLLGSVIAAVAVAGWTVFTYLEQRGDASGPNVEADRGSVAVGGDVKGDVNVGGFEEP